MVVFLIQATTFTQKKSGFGLDGAQQIHDGSSIGATHAKFNQCDVFNFFSYNLHDSILLWEIIRNNSWRHSYHLESNRMGNNLRTTAPFTRREASTRTAWLQESYGYLGYYTGANSFLVICGKVYTA